MSEEKKEGSCCGTQGSAGSCCGSKKILIFAVFGILLFVAGMLFAKSQCHMGSGAMCPLSGAPQK